MEDDEVNKAVEDELNQDNEEEEDDEVKQEKDEERDVYEKIKLVDQSMSSDVTALFSSPGEVAILSFPQETQTSSLLFELSDDILNPSLIGEVSIDSQTECMPRPSKIDEFTLDLRQAAALKQAEYDEAELLKKENVALLMDSSETDYPVPAINDSPNRYALPLPADIDLALSYPEEVLGRKLSLIITSFRVLKIN